MTILIATDIFGATPALRSMTRTLGQACLVVSPFDDQQQVFLDEKTAYDVFLEQGGVAPYAKRLTRLLERPDAAFQFAIGFSAGASALWLASAGEAARQLRSCTLFYGSRIREHKQVQAQCPVRLIFAENETTFSAAALCKDLQVLGHHVELVSGSKHGFMNPDSPGFDARLQAVYLEQLQLLTCELKSQASVVSQPQCGVD